MSASPMESLLRRVMGDRPRTAMIEVADRCNENCVHCYQIQGQKGEMSTEEVLDLLEQLQRAGVLFLTLSGGEITLRSDFLVILQRARELRFVVDIFTNGLRIDRQLAEEISKHHPRIVEISLYSSRPEKHDWITRVPGSFDRTTAAIAFLREFGVPVKVKSPIFSVTYDEHEELEALAEGWGALMNWDTSLRAREDGDRTPERLQPAPEKVDAFQRKVYPSTRTVDARDPVGPVCKASKVLHIEPNGQVHPCSMLQVPLGDVRDGLVAGTESKDARFLRQLVWRDLPDCSRCAIANVCSRCHAQALNEVGDALAPYPSACANAIRRWHEVTGTSLAATDSGAVGPFDVVEGRLEPKARAPLTEAQRSAYEDHPWLRKVARGAGPRVEPGQLVQLRRPGRRANTEAVPK